MSVSVSFTLVWMLTFEFSILGPNRNHARTFHYPHLWNSETSRMELHIEHDLPQRLTDTDIKERAVSQEEEEMSNMWSIPFLFEQNENICSAPHCRTAPSELLWIPELFEVINRCSRWWANSCQSRILLAAANSFHCASKLWIVCLCHPTVTLCHCSDLPFPSRL